MCISVCWVDLNSIKFSSSKINRRWVGVSTRRASLSTLNLKAWYHSLISVKGLNTVLPKDVMMSFPPSSVQFLSHVRLFVTPWTAVCQASLSIVNSQSLLKPMSIQSVMPSNHVILYHPLLLLPSVFPSIRIFSNESVLHIRWPKYWSFSFSISPFNEYSRLISFRVDWFDLLAV